MPLNISLFIQLLWGFPKRFFLLERTLASKWGFNPNTEAQALAPPHIYIFLMLLIMITRCQESNNSIILSSFFYKKNQIV